jgi:hypothetical protein
MLKAHHTENAKSRSYQESKGEELSNSNFCYNQSETETKQKNLKFGNL